MSQEAPFDPSCLSVLVLDRNDFQRNISIAQLRGLGIGRAAGARDIAEAWALLCRTNPDLVLVEGIDSGADPLDFVRRVRTREDAPNRAVSIFMLTSRGARTDVESARKAGVDGYLRKPISALGLGWRVRASIAKPQPFIVTGDYVGPCRRRRQDANYGGPLRRLEDKLAAPGLDGADAAELKAKLAHARVATLVACARDFRAGDLRAARQVANAAQSLLEAAERIGDAQLSFGAKEMVRYFQAFTAAGGLDPEVVRTHIAALHQLAHLAFTLTEEREQVAQSLKLMVDKKLQSGAAA